MQLHAELRTENTIVFLCAQLAQNCLASLEPLFHTTPSSAFQALHEGQPACLVCLLYLALACSALLLTSFSPACFCPAACPCHYTPVTSPMGGYMQKLVRVLGSFGMLNTSVSILSSQIAVCHWTHRPIPLSALCLSIDVFSSPAHSAIPHFADTFSH